MRELRHKNQDGQRVDKPGHDRLRQEGNEPSQLQHPHQDLKDSAEDRGGEQIFNAVVQHETADEQGHRTGRRRDHPWSASRNCGDNCDAEGGIQTHHRADSGQNRERDCFRDQGDRHRHP